MIITTERLILRPADKKDAAALLPYRNSEFVLRYNCMRERTLEELERDLERESAIEDIYYLEEKATGKVMGALYLTEDSLRYNVDSFMLEYWLGEDFARKGFMSEAINAVLDYAFNTKGCELITVRVFEENTASVKLVKKLGFTHEGTLRRCVKTHYGKIFSDCLFSMTKEEYK